MYTKSVLVGRPELQAFSNANIRAEEQEEMEEEEEEEEYLDETQVYLRSKFYESWLWTDVNLPDQADRDG